MRLAAERRRKLEEGWRCTHREHIRRRVRRTRVRTWSRRTGPWRCCTHYCSDHPRAETWGWHLMGASFGQWRTDGQSPTLARLWTGTSRSYRPLAESLQQWCCSMFWHHWRCTRAAKYIYIYIYNKVTEGRFVDVCDAGTLSTAVLYLCRSLRPVSTDSELWRNERNGGKCCEWEAKQFKRNILEQIPWDSCSGFFIAASCKDFNALHPSTCHRVFLTQRTLHFLSIKGRHSIFWNNCVVSVWMKLQIKLNYVLEKWQIYELWKVLKHGTP